MRRSLKISYITLGVGVVILLVIAGLAAYAHSAAFHAKMQTLASRGMGMQVSLDGPLHIGLLPSPNVTLYDVKVQNRGVDAGYVQKAYVRFRWLPLLRRDPEVDKVVLENPRILIKKGADGTLDLVRSTPPVHLRAHGPIEVSVTGGTVRYEQTKSSTTKTNAWVEARGCDVAAHEIYSEKPDGRRALERLSFSGADMSCKTVTASKFTGTDLKLHAVAPGKGVYDIKPITLLAFGSPAEANFHAQMSGDDESYTAALSVPNVQISRILADLGFRPIADGRVDLSGDLAYRGRSHADLLNSVTGGVSFHGTGVTLQGYDLDKELTRFERTQRFDLADFLGLFVADGAGILATKGFDYGQLIKGRRGGVSHIHEAVADLVVAEGTVHTRDVAMSTDTHRVAAQGKLDLSTDDFDHLTMALVDARGCVIAEDQLDGSIRKPKMKKPNIIATVAGPVKRLVKKGQDLFSKQGCSVFYDGSVKPY
ncbi:MAG TPA: AsmA family protein [Gammaproteobacteria bacterium]